MAFWNNQVFLAYTAKNGTRFRLVYHTIYKRWRNDDIPALALYTEEDTNTLLYSREINFPGGAAWAIIQDGVGDSDDGGWANGSLLQLPIQIGIKTPFFDYGLPDTPKQLNSLTIDANPNGQTITVSIQLDDPTAPLIVIGTITGVQRKKFDLTLNSGEGYQAYRVSLLLDCPSVAAPILYQANLEAAPLVDTRSSFDTYWFKFSQDESKLIKQGYFDYTSSAPITVQLFADGATTPYYTFTLPANPNRFEVPERVRFSPIKCRLWRLIATVPTGENFMFWHAPQIDVKGVETGKGYSKSELPTN
jgi:hypothetical protein